MAGSAIRTVMHAVLEVWLGAVVERTAGMAWHRQPSHAPDADGDNDLRSGRRPGEDCLDDGRCGVASRCRGVGGGLEQDAWLSSRCSC